MDENVVELVMSVVIMFLFANSVYFGLLFALTGVSPLVMLKEDLTFFFKLFLGSGVSGILFFAAKTLSEADKAK